jgi:glycogen debranching enzyme
MSTSPGKPLQPLQPLIHDDTVVLRAPTQAWSAHDGQMGSDPIHGVYFSDVRTISALAVSVDDRPIEHIATATPSAEAATFVYVVRHLDDGTPDPGVRAELTRSATISGFSERLELFSRLGHELTTTVRVDYRPDATVLDRIKAGLGSLRPPDVVIRPHSEQPGANWTANDVSVTLAAPGAAVTASSLSWVVTVPANGTVTIGWSIVMRDSLAVVLGVETEAPWGATLVKAGDERLARWVARALHDLSALRMATVAKPEAEFFAAGAPWFFTLFGRDSIWAARFMLPLGTGIAASTLRSLAELQGTTHVPSTAEEPGKIMHELRRGALEIPGAGIVLPPLYYGTVDATPLWICLLHDAWRWGMPTDEVRAMLPNLVRALKWMRDFGDSDGDGLLEYVDRTGKGLSNQGWKDSGDSVQWRDGTLAVGPIALCEVQGYAYEAATHGADLLDAFGGDGSVWRDWARTLRRAFHEKFWIDSPDGRYVAVALDRDKRAVDTVTSNIGHLFGTGILDDGQGALLARRLVSSDLNSGFGLRTMSTDAVGYWPLSYHGGSVWAHDTAIAVAGLARDGFRKESDELARGLLAAASGFNYRMPELHSGDSASDFSSPIPYPAACRPQAWSAAAAVSVLSSVLGLEPNAQSGELRISPSSVVGAVSVDGIVFAESAGSISVNSAAEVTSSSLPLVVG